MVNNKQLTLIAPTMHCTLPSCICTFHVQCICLARLLQNTFFNLGAMVTKTPENLCVRNH